MPHVNANGVSLHYQQAGAGPDVVLLHAVTANMAVWLVFNLVDTLARTIVSPRMTCAVTA